MPSDFDPEKVERIAIWMTGDDDVQVWDEYTHKRGHKTREEAYVSSVYVKAHLYDSLLSIYRSQQERIAELEGAVISLAKSVTDLHSEYSELAPCGTNDCEYLQPTNIPVVRSLLSKPEGESSS